MQPFLDAKTGSSAAAPCIPASAWRSLQTAVALLHILEAPDARSPASGISSMPPAVEADLTAAELALLQRHLSRMLTCPPSDLLQTGSNGSSLPHFFTTHELS